MDQVLSRRFFFMPSAGASWSTGWPCTMGTQIFSSTFRIAAPSPEVGRAGGGSAALGGASGAALAAGAPWGAAPAGLAPGAGATGELCDSGADEVVEAG